jgi:hypothetical protein
MHTIPGRRRLSAIGAEEIKTITSRFGIGIDGFLYLETIHASGDFYLTVLCST